MPKKQRTRERFPTSRHIGPFTVSIDRDDRGRIVAELWNTENGNTYERHSPRYAEISVN